MSLRYRLYIDEAGDHTVRSSNEIGKRYLALAGIIFEHAIAYPLFVRNLDDFKREHLPYDHDDPPVLHREDILHMRHHFRVLQNAERQAKFDRSYYS